MKPFWPSTSAALRLLILSLLQAAPTSGTQGWASNSPGALPAPSHPNQTIARDTLHARLLRFWDVQGEPIAVVQFALITQNKRATTGASGATVTFVLRQLGARQEVRDTTWQQATDQEIGNSSAQSMAGVVIVPLAPWLTSWSLVAGQTAWGTEISDNPVAQQPLERGPIVVSDLALGVSGSPGVALSGGHRALLALSGRFTRKDSVRLFYQVRATASHDDVRTWLTVTSVANAKRGKRVMQLSLPGRLTTGVNAIERILDFSKQKPGKYLLELQVGDLDGGGTSVRTAEFVVK
jgi:hypothetical protein